MFSKSISNGVVVQVRERVASHERPRLVRAWTRAEGTLHNNARDVARTGTR